jgi:superfamily II DNA or RNA helicase
VIEKIYPSGQMAFAEMITGLSECAARNNHIVRALIDLLPQRRKLIVVSALVHHCDVLRGSVLEALGHDAAVSTALMAGPTVETAKAKDPSTKIVFATYSMLEEGYDDPVLDTLLLATPRSRIQQTVGRIERTMEGKLRPLVVDFVDPFSVFPNMWYKRLAFYRSRGFLVVSKSS